MPADETTREDVLPVVINPLAFPEVERDAEPTAEDVIRYFIEDVDPAPANLARRYRTLIDKSASVSVIPSLKIIVQKMLMPLHGAVANYMLGNYHGTIALCGLVCEMLAIFLYDIHRIQISGQAPNEKTQAKMFGRSFEKLGQERRIDVLSAFGVLKEEYVTKFDAVRDIRRKHLHFLSQDVSDLPVDAKQCFQHTHDLLRVVFRSEFQNGKVGMRTQVVEYVKRHTPPQADDNKPA